MTTEEKLKEYELMIEELLKEASMTEGEITAISKAGYIKVKSGDGEVILKSERNKGLKKGQKIIFRGGAIIEVLPEDLTSIHSEEEATFSRIKWSEVGGMKSQIENIRTKVEAPITHKKIYEEFNLKPSKGILLHGPSGCGKTLIAKAIASSMLKGDKIQSEKFVYLKGGELLNKYVGETERRIKAIFDGARRVYRITGERPIIFIDEAEAILPERGSRMSSDVEKTIVPTFLSEMDGFEGYSPFVILATNFPENIDRAIIRPGRIDTKIYVGRPDEEDSKEIFVIHLKKTKCAEDIKALARKGVEHLFATKRLESVISGALIENIVNQAIEYAIKRKIKNPSIKTGVTIEDLLTSINEQ